MSAQETTLLNKLCEAQAENWRLRRAIKDFRAKRRAVENSQSDAFNHQGKRVQRRQHELREAREKLFRMIDE
jgi:hypothetical protein